MKSRYSILLQLIALTTLVALLVVACTTSPQTEQPSQQGQMEKAIASDSAAKTQAQQPTNLSGGGPAGSGMRKYAGQKIVVSWPSLSHFQAAAKLIPEFEAETGIKVEVDFIEYVKMKDKQVLEMSKPGNGDYDVVAWVVFTKNEYVAKGLLTPLSQFFANASLVDPTYDPADLVEPYLQSGSVAGGKKGYLPGPTDALYGLPFGAETSILAYRKDIFDQHNLKVPKTYDELLTTADWISKNVPNMKGITSRGQSGGQIVHAYLLHLSPFGGQVFDDKWQPVLNNEAGVKAAEALKKIIDNSPPGATTYDFGASANAFLQGEAAMYLDAHKIAAMSRDPKQSKVDGKVAYALHPTAAQCGAETGGQALGIPANAKNKEAAFLFIQWMTSKKADRKLPELGGDPIRKSTLADPELQKKFPEYPLLLEQLKCANVDWRPLIPEWNGFTGQIIGVELSNFVTGQKTAKQALDTAAEKMKAELQRNGYYGWLQH